MNRRLKIALISLVVIASVAIIWFFGGNKSKEKSLKTTTYSNWDDQYALSSKNPKGLFHWNSVLKLHLNKNKEIATIEYLYSIDSISRKTHPSFLFIGNYFVLYQEEIDSLLSRVKDGSKLFISSEKIDGAFYKSLFNDVDLSFYYDTSITVAANNKAYNFVAQHQAFAIAKKWSGYKSFQMKDSLQFSSLSGFGNLMNSGVIAYGKGEIFLNTTPELFTNYQFLTMDGYDYSKIWLNRIPKNEAIYWLEIGNFDKSTIKQDESAEKDSSYLQFIFQDRYRNIAILLFVIGIILFLLFRAKRMQPIIPIPLKKPNMSLIFADTITSIYFNQRNPAAMIRIQKANFYSTVQKHFNVDLSKNQSEKSIELLAQKTTISTSEISSIVNRLKVQDESTIDEKALLDTRKMVLDFYKKSGVISTHVHNKLNKELQELYRNEWLSGALILLGVGCVFYGMYLLILSVGNGVLLWLIGFVFIVFGVRFLMKPYIIWSKDEIRVKPIFGKEKVLILDKLSITYQDDKKVQLSVENKEVTISYSILNRTDVTRLKHFIEVYNKLK